MKHPREFQFYRPGAGECPPTMVCCRHEREMELDYIRIARDGDQVVGAYRFAKLTTTHYRIEALNVKSEIRRQGLGSWLLRHAIGIIESRGGRSIEVTLAQAHTVFLAAGFRRVSASVLRLELVAE